MLIIHWFETFLHRDFEAKRVHATCASHLLTVCHPRYGNKYLAGHIQHNCQTPARRDNCMRRKHHWPNKKLSLPFDTFKWIDSTPI